MGVIVMNSRSTSVIKWISLAGLIAGSAAMLSIAAPVMAADLPFFPSGPEQFKPGPYRGAFGGLMPERQFSGPARYDVYGRPIFGPAVAGLPNPLYASSGCPVALEPSYDALGNFAGYAPIQMCR